MQGPLAASPRTPGMDTAACFFIVKNAMMINDFHLNSCACDPPVCVANFLPVAAQFLDHPFLIIRVKRNSCLSLAAVSTTTADKNILKFGSWCLVHGIPLGWHKCSMNRRAIVGLVGDDCNLDDMLQNRVVWPCERLPLARYVTKEDCSRGLPPGGRITWLVLSVENAGTIYNEYSTDSCLAGAVRRCLWHQKTWKYLYHT